MVTSSGVQQLSLFQLDDQAPMAVAESVRPVRSIRRQPVDQWVDWFRVITDLTRSGYSIKTIAQRIRVPRSTVFGWKQGAEPRYSEGQRLVKLWCQVTGKRSDRIPMCDASCWWAYHAK